MWTIYKKLNVSPNSYPLVIPIKQYSSDFILKIKLYSTDGDLDIEAGATTKIRGTKRDGNGFELTGTRIGNTCTFSGTKEQMQQMTAAHGRCVFEIVVENNTRELITANFYLEVQRAAMDAGTVTSESIIEEFTDFQSKITAAQAAATAAEEQADRAEAAAHTLVIDPVPTQGSSSTVSSGGVYDEITGLKEELSDIGITKYLEGFTDGEYVTGYINSAGELYNAGNTNWKTTDYISVSEGDTLEYDLIGYGSTVYIITAYDSDKTRIASGSVVGSSSAQTGTYTVASGTAFIRISGSKNSTGFSSETITNGYANTKNYVDSAVASKADISYVDSAVAGVTVSTDATPTENSTNPVQSGGVYSALSAMQSDIQDEIADIAIYSYLNGWDTVNYVSGFQNNGGSITNNGNFRTTEFIPVTEGDAITYKLKGYGSTVYIIGAYDSNKAWVSASSVVGTSDYTESTYTVPSGVAYVRLSSGSYASASFSSDTIIGTVVANTQEYVDAINTALDARLTTAETKLNGLESADKVLAFYTTSPNLLNPSAVESAPSVGTDYYMSDYMPVTAGERYTVTADAVIYRIDWYDSGKTKLSSSSVSARGGEATAPTNAVYAKLIYKNATSVNVMFAQGVQGAYQAYGAIKKIESLPDYIARDTNNLINPDVYVDKANVNSSGAIVGYDSARVTDFIAVDEGSTYYKSGTLTGAAAYDSSYAFVADISSGFPYTVPSGVAYIRLGYYASVGLSLRKDNTDVTGLSSFDDYDTFVLTNAKPDAYQRANGLYGLKWNAMGDSITAGVATNTTYMQFIAERTGITYTNYGHSDTAIAKRSESSTTDMWTRYATMSDDADIITVFGGTNDHGNGITIGEWGDTTETTLYGAMKILCEGLINKYMGKRIGFITPLPKYVNSVDYSYPSESFKPYIDCIKDVCARYSIPVLDLYTGSGIAPSLASVRTAMITDGLHPNIVGHELISWKIQRFLERI